LGLRFEEFAPEDGGRVPKAWSKGCVIGDEGLEIKEVENRD
jgi:hypothetical protein